MNVGIVEPVGGHGGMDYYDYGLSLGIAKNDVNVSLYTSSETKVRIYENVTTVIVFKNMWKSHLLLKVFKYLYGHIKSFNDLKKKSIDLVHLHFFTFRVIDLLVILLAKLFRLKIVATIHDINSLDRKSVFLTEYFSYAFIDSIIVHNNSSLLAIKEKKIKLAPIYVIPHGNYLPFISVLPDKQVENIQLSLLFFGQIKQKKGVDILLKAVADLKNKGYSIKLLLYGKAWKSDLGFYTSLIKELGISDIVEAEFRYIDDDEIPLIFSRADIVVLPYTEIYQSGVLLLSMSYGKPVMCSDLEPFKEIILDGVTGFVFKSGDFLDLSKRLIELIQEKQLIEFVQQNTFSLIRDKYDWASIGASVKKVYENTLIR